MLSWLSLLIGQQILSRSITFLLNVTITRYLQVEQFGASMALALLESTVLFICREPLRRIVIRRGSSDYIQSCINSSWIASLPGSILLIITILYVRSSSIAIDACLWLYSLGLIVDMLTEPFYLTACASGRIPTRIAIESISAVLKIILIFILVLPPVSIGLLAYGWAQLGFSIAKLAMFAMDSKSLSAFPLPRRLSNGMWIDQTVSDLGGNFLLQSIEKYMLTEGETLALVMIAQDHHKQGVYALVQNLGSLIARFIFQPVEEIASLYFSKESRTFPERLNSISVLMKIMLIIGLLGVTFGPSYSFIVIHIIYGSAWSLGTNAPYILSLYCFYILFMALNGVTEAFMFSTISSDQLRFYNIWVLIPLSLIHILLSFTLISFGTEGLILVNCISMAFRILYSLHFMKTTLATSWKDLISGCSPDKIVLLVLITVSFLLNVSQQSLQVTTSPSSTSGLLHFIVGGCLLSIVGATIWFRENQFIDSCIDMTRNKKRTE